MPFTSIDLPKFKVEVVLTGANVSEATITGIDGIYGESKYYNITNKDGNILLTFDKAWTYNAAEDNQLIYNIKEAVAEVNRRLKVMYPFKSYYNEFDISETYDDNYKNKIFFDSDLIPINNNPGSCVLGWSKSKNQFVTTHVNNSGEYEYVNLNFVLGNNKEHRSPITAAMSYDRNICIYMNEFPDTLHGSHYARVNTSTNDNEFNYNWDLGINRWEDYSTRNNVFNFYPDSPSGCLGTVNNLNAVCFSPMIVRKSEGRKYALIAYNIDRTTKTCSQWWLDFNDRAKGNIVNVLAFGDVIDKDGNIINDLLAILAIYIDANSQADDIYTIGYFELKKSEISNDLNNPTKLITPVATKMIQAREWTDEHKLMTCGKECYGVIKAVDIDKTYLWFEGVYVLSYTNYNINDFYKAEGYKYDNDSLFMFDTLDNSWVLNRFRPLSS